MSVKKSMYIGNTSNIYVQVASIYSQKIHQGDLLHKPSNKFILAGNNTS
jgi:hypothetical protein